MPPKAPVKEAVAAKKTSTGSKNVIAAKKATKPTSTHGTRSKDPKPPPLAGETPYHPKKDVTRDLHWLGPRSASIAKRAAELYRLYGQAAIDAAGDDQTVLLNVCLDFAFDEDPTTLDAEGWRCSDDLEHRVGKVDEKHRGNAVYWMQKGGVMRDAIKPLIGKSQTDRMKAFYAVPNHIQSIDYGGTEEDQERWRKTRALAIYYKNHPDAGKKITKTPTAKEMTTKKVATCAKENNTPAIKNASGVCASAASAEKTPAKKTTAAKKTPAKKGSSAVKKSASTSKKAGVVKNTKKKTTKKTPTTLQGFEQAMSMNTPPIMRALMDKFMGQHSPR